MPKTTARMLYSDVSPRIKWWTAAFAFVFMTAELCLAQENIRFERISVNDGLAQSDVKSFIQDQFGFLWIGTRDGLNRYDGFEFRRYNRQEKDTTSLQFNQILDLAIDSSGNVWVGSTGGISMYDYRKDSFLNFFMRDKTLEDVDVNHILLTGQHAALLSTSKGLVSFDRKTGKFFVDPDLALFKGMRVLYAHQTRAGELWVGTDRGVFIKYPNRSDWVRMLTDHDIRHIYIDLNGNVYLSASNGLFRLAPESGNIEQVVATPDVTEVIRTKDGDMWVACNQVVVLDKNDNVRHILQHNRSDIHSLSENRARALFQTRDGVIWVGTFGYGLNKFNPDVARFSYLSEQTAIPLSGNYVSTVFTHDDTTLWVGTSRGLDVVDLKTRSAKHFSERDDLFQILKIISDQKNNIWVATSRGFMLYSNGALIPKNKSLRSVYHFAEWDDKDLILATRIDGIYLFDRTTNQTTVFIPVTDLPEEVSCMLVEDNHLWVGCKDGLKLFSRKGKLIKHFKADDQLPGQLHSSFVKSLFRDTRGNLWVGTWGGGLSMLNVKDSTFTTYTVNSGLPNSVIYGILEDSTGTLWLSTNQGISAFNVNDRTFRNFDFLDGLQSNEFNTGAYFFSAGGQMYFGGINGLSFFRPEKILERRPVPSILKTSITVNNKALTFLPGDSIRNVLMIDDMQSDWRANDIGLAFTAIDFQQAPKRRFQYAVNDTVWYDIEDRRSLELIDLSGGHHEIKVRTKGPDNHWSNDVALLRVDIVPPVWERAWFRIIAFVVLLAIIFAVYRYRVARLRWQNAALNDLVRKRTKEIQAKNEEIESQNDQLNDINNDLEAFSYSVSHDLRAPLRSIMGYSDILAEDFSEQLGEDGKRTLNTIRRNAARMNNLIEAMLEFSKSGRTGLERSEINTGELVKNTIDEIRASTSHRTEFRIGALPSIYGDHKLLSQVWINLISNAIKYSAKKESPIVEIGSYFDGEKTVFFVKDNGAGFDMKYADKLFGVFQRLHKLDEFEGTGVGLALVQRIVTKHGGHVWAEGKVNEGATFYFSLPQGK